VAIHPHTAKAFRILRAQNALANREGTDMEDVYKRIIGAIDGAGVRWTVVGAHAVNVYVRPRATEDIDLVVDAGKMDIVLQVVEKEFGEQQAVDIGGAVRLVGLEVDLIRSNNHPLFRAALDDALEEQGIRIPPPELLIALKFLAATSPWRRPADRGLDTADLMNVYDALGSKLDRGVALAYAAKIYPGADRELANVFDRIDRGERIQI
jgi:hypothetical protein